MEERMKLRKSGPKTRQTERFEERGSLPVIELECLANLDICGGQDEE